MASKKAIQTPAEHARWHPYASQIVGGHQLGQTRECTGSDGWSPASEPGSR